MPLLNPPNILPNGMYLIAKYLAHQKKPVERQRLKALLQPPTLSLRTGDDTFGSSLKALQDLQLADATGSTVAATNRLAQPTDVRAFGEALGPIICSVPPEGLNTAPQRDLLTALTWWCAQDPHGSPVDWHEVQIRLSHDIGPAFTSFSIGNSNPWNSFTRWATALGFAEYEQLGGPSGSALVPDITRAIRTALRTRQWAGPVAATELVSFVRKVLPVVDGGTLATDLRMDWDLPPGRRVADGALDLALSHALLRAEHDRFLKMDNLADAPAKVLLSDGTTVRLISHVTVEGDER